MMAKPGKPTPKRTPVKLEIPADLGAQYVNFALITHSLSEIILDFAQILPNTPKARVQSRILLTPTNAKLLHKALGESLAKFEAAHGEIGVPPTLADRLFGGVGLGGLPNDDDDSDETQGGDADA
jgi:hypothetical protein